MHIIKPCWYKKNIIKGRHSDSPLIAHVPKVLRRRLGEFGYNVLSVMDLCSPNNESDNMIWVMSSRHGDTNRMVQLFQNITDNELLSPTNFSMSVHNALPAMYSIKTKNTSMHTAVSAGIHSFSLGLLEAYVLCKTTKQTIGYLYYDFKLHDVYSTLAIDNQEAIIIGMTLDYTDESDLFLEYQHIKQNDFSFHLNNLIRFFCNNNDICEISMPCGQFTIKKI